MQLKIILLVVISAAFQLLLVNALRRIKRETHNNRIKDDFLVMPYKKLDHLEASKDNLKAANLELNQESNVALNDSYKKSNASRPLAELLRKREQTFHSTQKEYTNKVEDLTDDSKSKANEIYDTQLTTFGKKHNEHSKHHKNKKSPHVIHSTGMLEAKLVIPSQHLKPTLRGLNSFGAMQRLMNLDSLMMFDVDSYYPKMLLTENSPVIYAGEALNEPSDDYYFKPLEVAKEHNLYRPAFKQSNSPLIDDNWQRPGYFYKPSSAAVKEPTQLAELMENALDTLLGNNQYIEGGNNEQEIEISCPVHYAKKSASQMEGDKADVIQVCSCRFIKKGKNDEMKKLK